MRTEHSVNHDWWHISEARRIAIHAWMERNGIDVKAWWVISVRLVGEGAVEVYGLQTDADGEPYPPFPGTNEFATYRVVEAVTEPPPPEWWDDTVVAS